MAFRTMLSSRIPMVIVLGATGTGKTKLGVELAQKFGTEIISADSMQIYKGLDVVTAKATPLERSMAPHHLLDILEPHQMFTVVDFRSRALKIIDNLTEEGKIPIIVGGTNYYLESIVYKILVEDMDDAEALLWDKSRKKRDLDEIEGNDDVQNKKVARESKTDTNKLELEEGSTSKEQDTSKDEQVTEVSKEKLKEDVENETNFTNEEIHAKLKAIDPIMASRLHPNNRRKVLRSIEVWLKTGRRHSEILDEQKTTEGQLRRPGATIIFWLKCEQSVHDVRLDTRVDAMLKEGLIDELLDFHARHNRQRIQDGKPPDYTKGVFQTLGFKEFHKYLMLTEEQRNTDVGKELLQQSIEYMKISTRRYARRQNKMVRGRFLEHPNREVPPIYELDTTDVSKWDENVKNKAIKIIESFLNETPCEYEPVESKNREEVKGINTKSSNFCEVCNRLIIGDKQYGIHLRSNRHMKVLKKKKKIEEKQAQDQDKETNQIKQEANQEN
ncbi:tRNA dimethylallyltransferase [Pectinophora gossypiella]|uniref:tRNA dimethylallyltransferase n=1 Tax=Pectinophora gossypiella TaxID=13191 RepID=UPI00214E92F1|nr:tRNA dimethylallyltransferase [Pectinophora gossypiella]